MAPFLFLLNSLCLVERKNMAKKTPGVGFYGKVRIPTIGHKAAIDTAKNIASSVGGSLHVALSGAAYPLTSSQKTQHAKRLFQHPIETHHNNVIEFLSNMSKQHDDFTLVCGSDRAAEYRQLIKRYNGNKDRSGNVPFSFKNWRVHEITGKRTTSNKNPTQMSSDELLRTVSATKLEQLATKGKYKEFLAYHPGMNETHVKRLYDQIRRGKALREEAEHQGNINDLIDTFSDFVCSKLNISKKPVIKRMEDSDRSFGGYQPGDKTIHIVTKNRHPMDVFRTLAHELVHHKQDLDGRIKDVAKEGETGSPIEDEANSMAGRIMRWWAKKCPHHFSLDSLTENTAVFIVGGPCSGKDQIIRTLKEQTNIQEVDVHSLLKNFEIPSITIINASAHDLDSIVEAKKLLEHNDYTTSMLFVDTTDEISKLRNERRKELGQRIISESIRFTKFQKSQSNKQEFRKLFGESMKEVTNNVKFDTRIGKGNKPSDREWGKSSTVKIYQNDTPGQGPEDIAKWALPGGEKKLAKEAIDLKPVIKPSKKYKKTTEIPDNMSDDGGVGVGPTLGGHAKVQKPFGLAESVEKWMNNPVVRQRFELKYGKLAEQKMMFAATKLSEGLKHRTVKTMPKTLKQMRESIDKGALDTHSVLGPPLSMGDDLPDKDKIVTKKQKRINKK